MADHGAGVAAEVIVAGFERVELFDHIEWDDDVVVLEQEDCVGIVEQDVGIEHEVFHGGCRVAVRRARTFF